MNLQDILGRWLRRPTQTRPPAPRQRGLSLRLEHLDDRTVLATMSAASVAEPIADIGRGNPTPAGPPCRPRPRDRIQGRRAIVTTFANLAGLLFVVAHIGAAGADDPTQASSIEVQELTVGEPLPSLESTDHAGQVWRSADHVGRKVLVLYFYPGDFTGGCIKQAQAFRERLARLEELDVEVVGISGDEVATHKLFKESHALKHALLADPEGALAKRLGIAVRRGAKVRTRDLNGKPLLNEKNQSIIVERKVTLPRWTLIVGRDGKLVSKRTDVNPATDTEEVLKIVQTLSP